MNRIPWIDWAKVFCISLMIAGHMWMPQPIYYMITTFHMPALFIISGYLHKQATWKQSLYLVIPVIIFSIINYLIFYFADDTFIKDISFNSFFCTRNNNLFIGVWFIEALLLIKWIFVFFPKYIFCLTVFCVMIMTIMPFRHCGIWDYYPLRVFSSFPFYVFGFYLKKYQYNACRFRYLVSLVGVSTLILLQLDGYHNMHSNNFGFSYPTFFVGASIVSVGLFSLSSILKRSAIIETFSSGTLLILGIHGVLISFFSNILPGKLWPVSYIVIPLMVLFISYFLIRICLSYCPIILGKYPSKTNMMK